MHGSASSKLAMAAVLFLCLPFGAQAWTASNNRHSSAPISSSAFQNGLQAFLSKDYAKAFSIFLPLAKKGNVYAQVALGAMYARGNGVPQDTTKAIYWWHKAAAQGAYGAQYNLAQMYDLGRGIQEDNAKAAYWYRKAAAQGLVPAQFNLGVMYANGEGVPRDYVQAAKWFILAKAGGEEKASRTLSFVEKRMTPEQISKAKRLANQWWKEHHNQ
ncbi:MAG: sel1 repeat family protein [Gammaproteobacteria bacterium]|nr:sel1 repeat family protein [Gammaproteobacteria bacterium]